MPYKSWFRRQIGWSGALLAVLLPAGAPESRAGGWSADLAVAGARGVTVTALAAGPGISYAGTAANGVFKRQTGEASWVPANQGIAAGTVTALQVDLINPGFVFAIVDGRLLRTSDGGDHWAVTGLAAHTPNAATTMVALSPTDPARLYAVSADNRLWQSGDGGPTWQLMRLPLRAGEVIRSVAIDPTTPGTAYVLTGGARYRLFKTTDSGGHWLTVLRGNPLFALVGPLVIDQQDPSSLWSGDAVAGDRHLWHSANGGASWSISMTIGSSSKISAIAIDPVVSATLLCATSDGFIFRSADTGVTWGTAVVRNRPANALVINPDEPSLLLAAFNRIGVIESDDLGSHWQVANQGLPGE